MSLGSLFCGVSAFFIHTMFVMSWAQLAWFFWHHWDWNPWDHVAMNISMFSFFFLHVIAVNFCVALWAIGLWRSSLRMSRCVARR